MTVEIKKTAEGTPAIRGIISGTGFSVPERVVTNSHFAGYLETSDEWIRDRTGIAERRWIEGEVSSSMLAEPACRAAISAAGLTPADIGGVVLATVTPDFIFPSTACCLQRRLGISGGFAFDINAVCSGFIYALTVADALLAQQLAKHILVVGVDIYSRIINPNDRSTCILFGDGAGALVLSDPGSVEKRYVSEGKTVTKDTTKLNRGILSSVIHADGAYGDILQVPCGTAKVPTAESMMRGEHYLTMAGKEVFKLAVRHLGEVCLQALAKANVAAEEVDFVVAHQANKRILDAMAKQIGVPTEKILWNGDRYGNTSAASIPLLLAESIEAGVIKPGQTLLLNAFGGGVTWGALVIRL